MSTNLRFRKLRLQNWKNFASVDVAVQDRLFLVGPNASGKSNFLDVFRFLRDLASLGGGFQEAVGVDAAVVQKLITEYGGHPGTVYGQTGKDGPHTRVP